MKGKIFSTLAAAVLVLALGSMAKADTWTLAPGLSADGSLALGAGSTYTLTLTYSNATAFDAGVDWFSLQLFSNNITISSATIGGANFGTGNTWESFANEKGNNGADACTDAGHPGWLCADGGTNIFATIGAGSSLTFVLSGTYTGTAFDPINHLMSSGCTKVVSNSCDANGTGSWNISAPVDGQVPEPGSLALFGTGILGMAGYLRRKLLS
jgi:PEP-CTERM motif